MADKLKETLIIDDLIPEQQQDMYHNMVITHPWMFLKDVSGVTDQEYPSYGFTSIFKHPISGVLSGLFEAVSVPIINSAIEKLELEIEEITFNRAFLQLPLSQKFKKEHNGVHVDLPIPHYACIYYMNDSDGDTIIYEQTSDKVPGGSKNVKLKEHKRITPKKGRFVIFDGARYHCSSQPTENYRCIINFDLR